jgi:galactose mutarotase-like enzyme
MATNVLDIKHENYDTMPIVEIENEELAISIIPELGGKMVRLTSKKSGTQFLKEPAIDYQQFSKLDYGEEFLPPHTAGFDECFPNVSLSKYEINEKVLELPDHGELWTKPWKYQEHENAVTLWAHGEQLNYRFTKHIELEGSTIQITYELESLEEVPFEYMWSAHPLLDIAEGDQLILPEEISEVVLNWASDPNVGDLRDRLAWPELLGNNSNIDFNNVQNKSFEFAVKLFSDRLTNGKAGFYRQQTDETLLFSFDTEQVPFLGLWLCYGGWPTNRKEKEYTLALEPCNARPDSLAEACKWGDQQQISPLSIKCWEVDISVYNGKKNL